MKIVPLGNRFLSLVVAVCLVGPGAPLHGQSSDSVAPPEGPAAPAQVLSSALQPEPLQAGPELQKRMKTRVSVDFREAPIQDVIKTLAEQADIDIVKGPAVTGTVTATLTDVPLDEAMESIFTVHGYGYTTSESIVRIVPKSELAQYMVKYQTKVYHVAYADIEALDKAIKDMVSPKGKIAMNIETGHLCITDTEDSIKLLDEFIAAMDCEIPQILVEARIYDVSSAAFQDLGFNWTAGTFNLYDPDTGLPVVGETEPYTQTTFGSSIGQAPKATFSAGVGVLNDDVNINAMLTARRDDVKARLLANPKILVLNGQEANINIVSEIPYQELTQTSGGGNIGTTKFKEVGVKLLVTPEITRDNKIRLMLNPIFSVQTGTVALVIPTGLTAITSPQPIVDKREALTQALIKDGQTVVIGGLRKRDVVQEVSKVPLLGDIPLLGALFRFKGEKAINSELIVFITPHIITDTSLAPADARKLDTMNGEFREPEPPTNTVDCGTANDKP
jgi:type IV pilus assembly protein PilQ